MRIYEMMTQRENVLNNRFQLNFLRKCMKINLVNLYLDNEDYWFKLTLFSLTWDQALFSFLSVNNVPTENC